eukprot:Transcript_17843.p1 GENE.Transcript_17843~~Transcript_17843.p1  ORF type:complete len:539 (-),score=47.82 Transcript_17843:130-1683(-)
MLLSSFGSLPSSRSEATLEPPAKADREPDLLPGEDGSYENFKLHVLSPEKAGAGVCLDGSPPGFYYSPASPSSYNSSWLLHLVGGGWCTDLEACSVRSNTDRGTSRAWQDFPDSQRKSLLSSQPALNPFHRFNKAVLMYCDGASFSGHVEEPISFGGKRLYFRGRQVLASLIRALLKMGLAEAQQVLLTGISAGGLAAILQGDHVQSLLPPSVERFKVISFAGWFRSDKAACRDAAECPWMEAMRNAQSLHDMRSSLDARETDCLRKNGWACIHARYAAPRSKAPVFLVESSLDSWQLSNIWRGPKGANDEHGCVGSHFANCTAKELGQLDGDVAPTLCSPRLDPPTTLSSVISAPSEPKAPRVAAAFGTDLVSEISENLLTRPGNGAFITNCHIHDTTDFSPWTPWTTPPGYGSYELDGVSTAEAIRLWWEAPVDAPASEYTHLPGCSLLSASSRHLAADAAQDYLRGFNGTSGSCNPTCRVNEVDSRSAIDIIRPGHAPSEGKCMSDSTCLPNVP